MQIFQRVLVLTGLSKSIALVQKSKKIQFLDSFSSFQNEIEKEEQISMFYYLIIHSLSLASQWQQDQGL